ncbi:MULTISPECIES: hypothetical protein [Streptomyces]|uniref:hypothetical protein n=1 Tax=Streptomyces TaxID=1883 RepID=UPI0033B790D7
MGTSGTAVIGEIDHGRHPRRRRREPTTWFTGTEHWAHLERCLREDTLPLDVRTAGTLMLLYGMPITKVIELTTGHLHDGHPPHLQIGDHPAVLPPAVHQLLRHQITRAQTASAIGRATKRTMDLPRLHRRHPPLRPRARLQAPPPRPAGPALPQHRPPHPGR